MEQLEFDLEDPDFLDEIESEANGLIYYIKDLIYDNLICTANIQ